MLGEFENDRNLDCSSRHVPLPRPTWPPLLPNQGGITRGQDIDIDFDIEKMLTLTLTRHWHWHGQDIDKALTRLLHRPEHRPLPALRVHLEADYVGLPRLAHPPSSVDHDHDHVQVVLVVITTMILQPILILTSDKELKLKSKQFVMAESWLRHFFFIYLYYYTIHIIMY